MDRPDYPQDEKPGTPNSVPALIHDYRAQRDAWREQARNLARMREEVLEAADREAKDIVSVARADVRRILLKARRDLLVLAAQVRAAGRLGEPDDAPETVNFLPVDDLGGVQDALTSARHDVRRVLDETRPELEGLAAEGEALRAALRPHRPPAPGEFRRHLPVRTVPSLLDVQVERSSAPVDFEFTSIATDDPEEPFVETGLNRRLRTLLVAAASVGAIALMGTAWWVFRSPRETPASTAVETGAAADKKTPAAGAGVSGALAGSSAGSRTTTGSRTPGTPVRIAARDASWVRITVDGRVAVERTLGAGETEEVRAIRDVSVRAGDAGAVTVSVNGRQPVTLGDEGEVVTRRFAVESPRPETPPAPVAPNRSNTASGSMPLRPASAPPAPPSTATLAGSPARVLDAPLLTTPSAAPVPTPPVPPATATAGARPTTAVIDRPAPSLAAPSTSVSLQESLASQATRFQDAYYRQDRASMASISSAPINISDNRAEKERLPRGLTGIRRSLEDVNVQVFGSEAMLTAKMTERMEDVAAGKGAQAVSFISYMWTQRNGAWQLHDVTIVSASAISRSLTR